MFDVTLRRALLIVLGIAALSAAIMYAAGMRHVIRSDGAGYYAYLPAVALQGSVDMTDAVVPDYEIDPEWLRRDPTTGRAFNKFPIGTAVMIAPFFFLAHALTHITPFARDGFSPLYQLAVALAGLVYGGLGLWLLARNHTARFQTRAGSLVLAVAFGTNVFHYLTYDAVFSHIYSFFLFALLIALTTSFRTRMTAATTLGLGVVAGLILLVRPSNGVALLYVPWVLFARRRDAPHRSLLGTFAALVVVGLVAAVLVVPQLLYFRKTSGHWLSYAYGHERFYFASPMALHVLLSLKKGLFVWTPMLALAFLGQRRLAQVAPADKVVWIVIVALQLVLVACWWNWWYGGSFGHRAFTEYIAFFALPLGALVSEPDLSLWKKRALVGTLAFEVVAMALYWARVIPYEGF